MGMERPVKPMTIGRSLHGLSPGRRPVTLPRLFFASFLFFATHRTRATLTTTERASYTDGPRLNAELLWLTEAFMSLESGRREVPSSQPSQRRRGSHFTSAGRPWVSRGTDGLLQIIRGVYMLHTRVRGCVPRPGQSIMT